jgi:hypothetical protein
MNQVNTATPEEKSPGQRRLVPCSPRVKTSETGREDIGALPVKDAAIGAVAGAAVGAAGGAIVGGVEGAGKSAAIGGIVGGAAGRYTG